MYYCEKRARSSSSPSQRPEGARQRGAAAAGGRGTGGGGHEHDDELVGPDGDGVLLAVDVPQLDLVPVGEEGVEPEDEVVVAAEEARHASDDTGGCRSPRP